MPAAKPDQRPAEDSQTKPPAKGGTEPAGTTTRPSGDSPKPHGDPLKQIIADQK